VNSSNAQVALSWTAPTGVISQAPAPKHFFRKNINIPEGAFVPPCPGEAYVLDENTGLWVVPS